MKTAVIFYGGFLSKAGGAFFHARNLANVLTSEGWDVELVTLDKLPIWCRYLPHLVAAVVNLVYAPFGFLYKASLTKRMYEYFFKLDVDLIVFEDIYLAWDSSTPSITILHAVWSDNLQAYSVSEKRLGKFRDREAALINQIPHPLATVSYPYREYIYQEHFSNTISKSMEVIELGIDQSKFDKFNAPLRTNKSIVYCGALEARKNVSFLLKVLKGIIVIDPEYKLTIIGDGPERSQLMTYAREQQLPVSFLGRLTNQEALAELHRHEIYAHTSLKESFSYSLLEAKMAGLVTCAYAKLQIPGEFMDVGIESFCVNDWCNAIVNINPRIDKFDGSKFTAERMTQATLSLVSNWAK